MALTAFDYRMSITLLDNNSKEYSNVFYLKAQAGFQGNPLDLKLAFQNTVEGALERVLHTSMASGTYSITKLDGSGAFSEGALTFSGGLCTGEHMPDFVGWAFRLVRPTNLIRSGRKCFGRISESDVVNGVVKPDGAGIDSTTWVNDLATALETPWQAVLAPATNYKICIPHSVNVAPEGEEKVYELEGLYEASAVEYVRVSTQNSRKS